MSQFFRDQIWEFVGVVVSVLALGVAIFAIRSQRRRKSLGYWFASDRPVLYLFDQGLKDRLTLSLDGKAVQGLSTFELALFNDGNVPILPSDYAEPVRIELEGSSKVLAVAIADSHPPNLGVSIEADGQFFTVSPILLNPGDEYVVQFLVDKPHRDHFTLPSVRGRIVGVTEIKRRSSRPSLAHRMGFFGFFLARSLPVFALGAATSIGAAALAAWVYSFFKATP
jgi:hypothetical protein